MRFHWREMLLQQSQMKRTLLKFVREAEPPHFSCFALAIQLCASDVSYKSNAKSKDDVKDDKDCEDEEVCEDEEEYEMKVQT